MKTRITKTFLKKNKGGELALPDIKSYYDCGKKKVWYSHKNKKSDQWDRKELPGVGAGTHEGKNT